MTRKSLSIMLSIVSLTALVLLAGFAARAWLDAVPILDMRL